MSSGTEKRWVLPAFIVLGVLCLLFAGGKLGSPASAQVQLQAEGAGRVLVVPVQIARDSYGLAMVDTVSETLWIYELNSRGPVHKRLRLLAARSWRYDRLLQELNTDRPKPEEVKMLLQSLGQPQKEPSSRKQHGLGVNVLEIAEPNYGSFGR
jgi:hypothetical protein